jgi:glycosyltransferase involved in cell wall biosynthesis
VDKKRVLIAHQSTIPHYRVPFYEGVERLRPSWWNFSVVWDPQPARRRKLFVEPVDGASFGFGVMPTRTFVVRWGAKKFAFQSFVTRCRDFDLVIVEDVVHNLSYQLVPWLKTRRTALAYWGHGRDRSAVSPSKSKVFTEKLKLYRAKRAQAYFAYTKGVRSDLIEAGLAANKIHVLNNTIDILAERSEHESAISRRRILRNERSLEGRRVLLYVGRLDARKNLPMLAEAFKLLCERDSRYHLVMIGGGDESLVDEFRSNAGSDSVTYCGVIVDRGALAEWYAVADLYAFPGDVGLGVVQALSHSLPPVIVERPTHNPEIEYLDIQNSVIVPAPVSAESYSTAIHRLFSEPDRLADLRASAWPSIRHLTIEAMARNFVNGVGSVLRSF